MSKYADQRANIRDELEEKFEKVFDIKEELETLSAQVDQYIEHLARIEARLDVLEKAFDERLKLVEATENPDYLKEQFDDPIGQLEEIFNLGNYRREEE
jgi:uncharacterized coiled-coil DUF342 family protein